MKRFTIKILIFFVLIVVCDFCLGSVIKLYKYASGGEIGKIQSIMSEIEPEILIIGSSRANHHYNPKIITDSLALSAYNAGFDGQGTTLSYGFLLGMSQRKLPEYVVLDILPQFDLFNSERNVNTNLLYPYIHIPGIESLIIDFDSNDKWKLYSNAYRLNSELPKLLSSILKSERDKNNGFNPMTGKMNKDDIKNNLKDYPSINELKEKYLKTLIEYLDSHGCKLVVAISPVYKGDDEARFKEELDIFKSYDVPIINHLNDSLIINNPEYFQDSFHMNSDGAIVYTNLVIKDLKKIYPEIRQDRISPFKE